MAKESLFISVLAALTFTPLFAFEYQYKLLSSPLFSTALSEGDVAVEVSEQLFDRTNLVMQTRYASYPMAAEIEDEISFIPQMTSLWEQACLVQIDLNRSQKFFIDLGFGYQLKRYAYHDFFDDSLEYFWSPALVIPLTFHFNSLFYNWDTLTDLHFSLEFSPESQARGTTLTHQMLALQNENKEVFLKMFAHHQHVSFNEDFFGDFSNYSMGLIFESFSR